MCQPFGTFRKSTFLYSIVIWSPESYTYTTRVETGNRRKVRVHWSGGGGQFHRRGGNI